MNSLIGKLMKAFNGEPKVVESEINLGELSIKAQESTDPEYVEQVLKIIMRREGDTRRYRKVMGHLAFLKRVDISIRQLQDEIDDIIKLLDDGEGDE